MKRKFAERLKELRGSMSQEEFASKIGEKQTSYSSWERGAREPVISVLENISNRLGVSTDWLLGLTNQRSPFIEVPRENKVSKTAGNEEKFPSFIRPICRSVRQYYKDTTNGAEKQERKDQDDVWMRNRLDFCGSADDWRLLHAAGSRRFR